MADYYSFDLNKDSLIGYICFPDGQDKGLIFLQKKFTYPDGQVTTTNASGWAKADLKDSTLQKAYVDVVGIFSHSSYQSNLKPLVDHVRAGKQALHKELRDTDLTNKLKAHKGHKKLDNLLTRIKRIFRLPLDIPDPSLIIQLQNNKQSEEE